MWLVLAACQLQVVSQPVELCLDVAARMFEFKSIRRLGSAESPGTHSNAGAGRSVIARSLRPAGGVTGDPTSGV